VGGAGLSCNILTYNYVSITRHLPIFTAKIIEGQNFDFALLISREWKFCISGRQYSGKKKIFPQFLTTKY